MSKSLTDRTVSGLNWNFISNYSNTISTIIVGIVLARLLTPEDFGMVGMVTIFIGLADLFVTLGMGQSIVRIQNVTERHIRVATTVTVLSSLIIFVVFFILAPLVSDFYNKDGLTEILQVLSILFIIKGINTVSFAQLQKKLEFKSITIIQISTNITYGITSIVLAILDYGVWSLVYGRILSAIMSAYLTTKKYPVNLKPSLSKIEFKELAGFGSGVSLSNILLYGSSNIDYLIIGKLASASALGLYTKSFNLMTNSIDKITGGMFKVLFPAFAAVQHEKDKLRKAYYRALRTVSFFLLPILGILLVTGEYVIIGLYGEKWAGAVKTFQILAIAGILRSTLMLSGSIAHATGKIFIESGQQLIYFLILGTAAYFGISYGIEGVALAVVLALIWMFFAQSFLAIRIIESNLKEFISALFPGLFNLIIVVVINYFLVILIESIIGNTFYEVKLIISVTINLILFISLILFTPISVKGDTIEWIMEKYSRLIPLKMQNIYYSFNSTKSTQL